MYRQLLLTAFFLLSNIGFLKSQSLLQVDLDEINIVDASVRSQISADTLVRHLPKSSSSPFYSTSLNFREYAPHGISTFTIRGTNPQQNTLYWNGFLVQNPMLGLNDLSLFPTQLFDEITISRSERTDLLLTGSPGGVISYRNQATRDSSYMVFESSYDQNHNSQSRAGINYSVGNTDWMVRALYNKNQNKYRHLDRFGNKKTAEHSRVNQKGIILGTSSQLGKNFRLNANLWWQDTDRQIPPTLFESRSRAEQHDTHLRTHLSLQKTWGSLLLNFHTAFFQEELVYRDPMMDEYSDSRIRDFQNIFTIWWNSPVGIPIKWEGSTQHLGIKTDVYEGEIEDQNYFLSLSTNSAHLLSPFKASFQFKKEFSSRASAPALMHIQVAYQVNEHHLFSSSLGNHFRLPTYNDHYWPVLGNPDLDPENGWHADLNWNYSVVAPPLKEVSVSAFFRRTEDLIFWTNRSGLWRPENMIRVRAYGLELRSRYSLETFGLPLEGDLGYDYVVSTPEVPRFAGDQAPGKQLPYLPRHSIFKRLSFHWESWVFNTSARFISDRFTDSAHSHSLPAHWVVNSSLGYRFQLFNAKTEVSVYADNLLNTTYQAVNHRPMPLRTFGINFIYHLNL